MAKGIAEIVEETEIEDVEDVAVPKPRRGRGPKVPGITPVTVRVEFSDEDGLLLKKFALTNGCKVIKVAADLLVEGFENKREELETVAKEYDVTHPKTEKTAKAAKTVDAMTPEELKEALAAQEKREAAAAARKQAILDRLNSLS